MPLFYCRRLRLRIFANSLPVLNDPAAVESLHFLVYSGIGTRGLLAMRNSALRLGKADRAIEAFLISAEG